MSLPANVWLFIILIIVTLVIIPLSTVIWRWRMRAAVQGRLEHEMGTTGASVSSDRPPPADLDAVTQAKA